jgi:hypothetical protein
MPKKLKYLYRKKPQYWKRPKDSEFLKCSEAAKNKIEKMHPNGYEFKSIEPPKPTPSMIDKETENKTTE